jgi:hypothetical protein
MASTIVTEQLLNVGKSSLIEGPSPMTELSAVFEDDGEAGYFYALDTSILDNQIVDALYIYNVENVADRRNQSTVQIVWSEDGRKAALLINGYTHAIFDFEEKRGYCRTGFPEPSESWSGHSWDDKALELF